MTGCCQQMLPRWQPALQRTISACDASPFPCGVNGNAFQRLPTAGRHDGHAHGRSGDNVRSRDAIRRHLQGQLIAASVHLEVVPWTQDGKPSPMQTRGEGIVRCHQPTVQVNWQDVSTGVACRRRRLQQFPFGDGHEHEISMRGYRGAAKPEAATQHAEAVGAFQYTVLRQETARSHAVANDFPGVQTREILPQRSSTCRFRILQARTVLGELLDLWRRFRQGW
mmetsp:Transcript_90376/g.255121  ORF Transcript_90376/g.255121 Transcript_90376/m.255121 type:complete len:224 (-) Transcript_90376:297-968(-)